jgi:hypothetical protein
VLADHTTYAVETDYGPFLISLCIGWLVLFLGVVVYGRRFAYFALPLGIAIPLSQLAFKGLWIWLLSPEIWAWNAAYWLAPSLPVTGVALLVRRLSIRK